MGTLGYFNPPSAIFAMLAQKLRHLHNFPVGPTIFMPRLVYNRIAKAGSTSMLVLLAELAKQNEFALVNDDRYWMSRAELNTTLLSLPSDAIYVNHCNYLPGLPRDDFIWINVARDPIELEESYYYYRVSPVRGELGETERKRDRADPCGCPDLEFDDCYRGYLLSDRCEYRMRLNHSALRYFHDATDDQRVNRHSGGFATSKLSDGFTSAMAFNRAQSDYAFVGITEEMELTVMALETLFPRFFSNATAVFRSLNRKGAHANKTPEINPFTHTQKNGGVTTLVKDTLKHYNPDDVAFYENVKRLFWWKVTKLFPELITTH